MSRIVLSAAARADRRAVTAYTVERSGVHQARRLRDRFAQVFNILAHKPAIGRLRPELGSRHRTGLDSR
jgi:plasmid stabilization system protein ParE